MENGAARGEYEAGHLARLGRSVAIAAALSLVAVPAIPFEIPTTPNGSWTASGVTSGTIPFSPSTLAVQTGSYYKTTPSGLRMTVTTDGAFPNGASGSYFMTPPQTGTGGLNPSGAGSNPGAFTLSPVMPIGANAIQLVTSVNPCQTTFSGSTTCTGLGTLRLAFTDPLGGAVPVVAPKIHVTRLGGTIGSMELATGLQINAGGSTSGISFSAIAGARTATLTVNGTEFFGDPNVAGTTLNVNCGVNASTTAGCGSVQVNGSPSTILLNVKAYRTTVSPSNWVNGADGYWLDVSFDEDYGGAPTSYEGGGTAAAHLLTDLRLGSGVSAERISAAADANGGATGASLFTTSPNAVANGSAPGDSNDAGVTFPTLAVSMTGATYSVTPTISGASRGGELCGWIDFNDNNAFAASEGSCATFSAGATSVPLSWTLPSGMVAGFTYARFRVTYDTNISTTSFNGLFSSGEVEDFSLTILAGVDAVNDNFSSVPINGTSGGTTATVFSNDTLNGSSFAASAVTPTLTNNGGLTGAVLNANGTITVPAGTTSGTYTLTYQICDVANPSSCDTATAVVVVAVSPPTGGTSCTGTNLAINGGIELPFFGPGTNNMVAPTGVTGWSTNDTAIEIWGTGFNGVPSHTGVQFMEMNANIGTSVLVQTPSAIHSRAQIDTFWAHRGRNGNDTARMTIADSGGGSTTSPNFTSGNTAWTNQSLIHVATAAATSITLTFDSISSTGGASLGNFIDTVEVCQTYLTIAKSESSRTDVDGSTTDTVGDTITYQYAIANPAGNNRSLGSISITDDKIGAIPVGTPLSGDSNSNGFLDPGETWIAQATYTIAQADIDAGSVVNIAYVSGSTGSNSIRSDDSQVTATLTRAPALTIVKAADPASLLADRPVGHVVTYTYTITNTGNTTVTNVTVADAHDGLGTPLPTPGGEAPVSVPNGSTDGGVNGSWDTLKPGDQIAFTATYTIHQLDVDQRQ